jgi:TP901 family phage tail tape measure protein
MDVLTRAAADSHHERRGTIRRGKTGGPIAKTAGVSLEQFVGYTESLANVGIKGGEAGTAIRQHVPRARLADTAAAKGMAHLGVKLAKTKTGAIDMTARRSSGSRKRRENDASAEDQGARQRVRRAHDRARSSI